MNRLTDLLSQPACTFCAGPCDPRVGFSNIGLLHGTRYQTCSDACLDRLAVAWDCTRTTREDSRDA